MDPNHLLDTMSPFVQYGFAGFAFVVFGVLTSIIVWMIKQLLKVLKENNIVVAGNTKAIEQVSDTADEQKTLLSGIRDELLKRPCMFRNQDQK